MVMKVSGELLCSVKVARCKAVGVKDRDGRCLNQKQSTLGKFKITLIVNCLCIFKVLARTEAETQTFLIAFFSLVPQPRLEL
jgi:hypothetical protein